jgi:RNA polymerase sigma-70 factor (ECF subfamily)
MTSEHDSLALVQRLSEGDRSALDPLLDRHLPDLHAFVRLRMGRFLRDREGSLDLAQSVCREVLEHAGRFRHPNEAAFRRWLFLEAVRKIRQRHAYHLAQKRDPYREVPREAGESMLLARYRTLCTPSRTAAAREELQRVEAAFERLSDDHRQVLLLARVAGLPHAEVARAMERSEGAVRTLLFRASARLAQILTETA